jgi:transposase
MQQSAQSKKVHRNSRLRFFCKLKEFKRIAMRASKTDRSYEAFIYLAAAVINSR